MSKITLSENNFQIENMVKNFDCWDFTLQLSKIFQSKYEFHDLFWIKNVNLYESMDVTVIGGEMTL